MIASVSPLLLLLLLLLSSSLFLNLSFLVEAVANSTESSDDIKSNTTYGVIVDCGSSGTRANIFEWNSNLKYPELLHDIEPMRDSRGEPVTMKIKPGLASLADDPSKSSDYMQPIIDFISDRIPGKSLQSAGIYLMGTAGMRLLDSGTQLSIMNDIAQDLKSNYNFAKVETSVISGSMEGIYQWISVNSRLKRFSPSILPRTLAVMEMGGASTQITYQMRPGMYESISESLTAGSSPEALKSFQSQVVEPQMGPHFKIFSTSFLGFGSNSAREAYVDLLIMSNKRNRFQKKTISRIRSNRFHSRDRETLYLSDPCLPKGSSQRMRKPTRMLSVRNQTVGFVVDDNEPTFEVSLNGQGQFYKCRSLLQAMLQLAQNERMNCKPEEDGCAMSLLGTHFVPHQDVKFIGLSDFYYTTKEVMNLHGGYNRDLIIEATKRICSTSYERLLKMYPEANKNDPSRIRLECFKALWIDVFLMNGTKMPPENRNLQTIGQIDGQSIDWTLGAVLDKSLSIEKATEDANNKG